MLLIFMWLRNTRIEVVKVYETRIVLPVLGGFGRDSMRCTISVEHLP